MRIYQPTITGSLNVSGSVTAESFTGSLFGSSSYALTASYALNGGGGGSGAGFPYSGSAVITGSLTVSSSLIVIGSTISTEGFTGSLEGTASFAVSSSYAISSSYSMTSSYSQVAQSTVSASYAATSSYSTNFTAATSLIIDGAIQKGTSIASTIVGTYNLFTDPTGSYTSAFGRYTVYRGANSRSGEFITSWNGSTTTYTDVSTTDIGNTSDVSFISARVFGDIQISVVTATSGWTVRMLVMYL